MILPKLWRTCLEQAEARGLLNRIHSLEDVLAVDREARLMARLGDSQPDEQTGLHGEPSAVSHLLTNRIGRR